MSLRDNIIGMGICLALAFSAPANAKKKYEISKMPKALYLTDPSAKDANLEFSAANCPDLKPGADNAYAYLQMITSAGNRRSGSQNMRCAVEAVRRVLESFGYKVEVMSYRFPYYYFDDQTFSLLEKGSGRRVPVHPLMYSANTGSDPDQEVLGKVVRPGNVGKGDLVFIKPGTKDLALKAQKWQKAGAIGVVMDSNEFPFNMTGLPVAHLLHSTSWHYAALPGLVAEGASKLVGKNVALKNLSHIYAGRGYDVIAFTPGDFDNYVLVGGHLDSWYMGALDDGTGAALMLRLAELMKNEKSGRTGFIFAAFDGEELGLFGSQVLYERFGAGKIKAMLNLDMVSVKDDFLYKDPAKARIMPKVISASPELMPMAKDFYKDLKAVKIYWSLHDFARIFKGGLPTDLEWFWAAGVPGVFVYTPDKYYHTEQDTMKWMDAGDMENLAQASAGLLKGLASDEIPRPEDSPKMDFEFHRQDNGTVVFDVHLSRGEEINVHVKPAPAVFCYYEHGFEKKVELKAGQGGGYRGVYAPLYKGEYEFIASATVDKEPRKVVKSMVITDPMKEEPKEPKKTKGGRKK